MGTKVQLDNYYSMRDLNHDTNGTSWSSYCGESNLPNGQHYYSVLPRPSPDLFPEVDKDLVKQKMLEHETVFKNQVFELHRVYRVQRDLMDEIRKKETPYEAMSSSSPLASQTTPEDARRRTSSSFLYSNTVCGGPPVGGVHKGKNVQGGGPALSEVSESRPTKLRKMIDLQLPAEEYLDTDEGMTVDSRHCEVSRKQNALADLNEPPEIEEPIASSSVDFLGVRNQALVAKVPNPAEGVLWNSSHGNRNAPQNNSRYNHEGNQESWLSSVVKTGVTNDNGMFLHHRTREDLWPAKPNDGFVVFEQSHFSNFNNSQGITHSQVPPNVPLSSFMNAWDISHGKQPVSVQTNPLPGSASFSNGFLGTWWHRNGDSRSNSGYVTKTQVQNGFYHGSSSGECKELSAHFSKAGPNYINDSYIDKVASGSRDFLRGQNSQDFKDLNLNVAIPNGLTNESFAPQTEANREDSFSVLPWLRAKTNQVVNSRNCLNEPKSGFFHDHQDSVASTSCNVDHRSSSQMILGVPICQLSVLGEQEIDSGKKKLLFDINLPCDEPEEIVEDDKVETEHPNGIRHMIDLNSCVNEDEIPSSTITNSMKRLDRCIIDLEAPPDLEDDNVVDEELVTDPHQPPSSSADSSDEILARVAAEAIISISSSVPKDRVDETSEDALRWFVDIVCSRSDDNTMDCTSSESDYFEEMTLKLTECTVDEYFPDPPNFDIPTVSRARRGPARRGRQKRDFQRDILPGLTSLARNEVTEDLQTFGGLMRATGHDWDCGNRRNSSRNGSRRGRRRAVATLPPSPPLVNDTTTAFASSQKQIPNNGEIIVLEDRSLTSWGKTTRRPRRQRCPSGVAGNPAPISLT